MMCAGSENDGLESVQDTAFEGRSEMSGRGYDAPYGALIELCAQNICLLVHGRARGLFKELIEASRDGRRRKSRIPVAGGDLFVCMLCLPTTNRYTRRHLKRRMQRQIYTI